MSEMIERVADALEAEFKQRIVGHSGQPFEETGVGLPNRAVWTGYARAAVKAMREPTEPMKLAGGMIPEAFKGTGAARGNADRVYKAMIDEVLK